MFLFTRTSLSLFLVLLCATTLLLSPSTADSDVDAKMSSTTVTAEEAAVVDANPLMSAMTPKQQTRVTKLHEGIKKHGCRLKLCFLLEASRFIRRDDYLSEKNFADLIVAITTTDTADNPSRAARLCGATYARRVRRFVPHLVTNRTTFLRRLHGARRPRWGLRGAAHAGKALRFALKRFDSRRKARAAKIVLFGTARRLRTRLRGYDLPREMGRFKRRGGTVCGVSLNQSTAPELKRVLGDEALVAPIDGFFDISEIIVATVASLCDVPCDGEEEKDGKEEMELTDKEMKDMCPKESVMEAKLMTGSTEENEEEKEEQPSSGGDDGGNGGNGGSGGNGGNGGNGSTGSNGSNGSNDSTGSAGSTNSTKSTGSTNSTGSPDNTNLDTAGLVAASQEFEDEQDDEVFATPSD